MSTITYSFTLDPTSKPLTLSASPEGLTVTEGTKTSLITWSDVMRVELAHREQYRCRLLTRSGRIIDFGSTTSRGAGDSVEQPGEYREFVEAIHANVRTHGKNVKFIGSRGGPRDKLIFIAILVALAALSVPLGYGGMPYLNSSRGIGNLVLALVFVFWACKWISKNRTAIYDPKAIPDALLPKAAMPRGTLQERGLK